MSDSRFSNTISIINQNISIIIPTYNCRKDLEKLTRSLEIQTLMPSEVIVSDSSEESEIEDYVKNYQGPIAFRYLKSDKRFPGEKRNAGAHLAKNELIAFLDVATIPYPEWLENYVQKIEEGYDVVFGSTKYKKITTKQGIIRAATFGRVGHETSPGTLLRREAYTASGGFIEGLRAGDDLDWREELRSIGAKCFTPNRTFIEYSNLPNSILEMQKKYFYYYLYSGKLRAQRNTRDLYLGALLVLSALIIPRWNFLISGAISVSGVAAGPNSWVDNPLFIPNITKIYIISFLVLTASYIFINRISIKGRTDSVLCFIMKLCSFFIVFWMVYHWNASISTWVEDVSLYIPHLTKIYVSLVLLFSILYRGIYLPLKLDISPRYLFPVRWLLVGMVGLTLDIAKIPGTLIGIFLAPFQTK